VPRRGILNNASGLLTPENVIKPADFGIAKSKTDRKLTMSGSTAGSLYYMPPGQVQGTNRDVQPA
jgi:serine/threonine protein kinase